jgi:hypothetical protein
MTISQGYELLVVFKAYFGNEHGVFRSIQCCRVYDFVRISQGY